MTPIISQCCVVHCANPLGRYRTPFLNTVTALIIPDSLEVAVAVASSFGLGLVWSLMVRRLDPCHGALVSAVFDVSLENVMMLYIAYVRDGVNFCAGDLGPFLTAANADAGAAASLLLHFQLLKGQNLGPPAEVSCRQHQDTAA